MTMYLVPASPDLLIRDPFNMQALPVEGKEVKGNFKYWRRRLRDGDVKLGSPPKVAKKSTK